MVAKTIGECSPDIIIWGYKKIIQETEEIICEKDFFSNEKNCSIKSILEITDKGIYNTSSCTKAVKRDVIKCNDLSFVEGDTSEDIEWSATLLRKTKNIVAIPTNFYVYRQRAGSITKTKTRKNVNDLLRHIDNIVAKRNFAFLEDSFKTLYMSFAAEQFANAVIVVASNMSNKEDIEFVSKYKHILKKGRTKRCRCLALMLRFLSVSCTLRIIMWVRKCKAKF